MDQTNQLRQLIRESIQEYIREVETSGNIAAQEAKIRACEEAIALREKKVNMEGLDEAYHDMMDSAKLNELKKEVKELQKYKAKAEKLLEKMKAKAEGKMAPKKMEDEGMNEETEEGMVDEVNLDEYTSDPAAGPELEEALRAGVYDDFEKWKKSFPEGTKFEQANGYMVAKDTTGKELGKWNPVSIKGMHADDFQYKNLEERKKMTAAQKSKKEDIVKGMKKSKSFGKSKEGKSEMYATATKLAMKEDKQFLHMQKLAGLITETQYKEKMQILSEEEKNLDLPIVQKYGKEIGKNYIASVPASNQESAEDVPRLDARVKLLGMSEYGKDTGEFRLEFLEDKFFKENDMPYAHKKGDVIVLKDKYIK